MKAAKNTEGIKTRSSKKKTKKQINENPWMEEAYLNDCHCGSDSGFLTSEEYLAGRYSCEVATALEGTTSHHCPTEVRVKQGKGGTKYMVGWAIIAQVNFKKN